jgi:hypothetical protein
MGLVDQVINQEVFSQLDPAVQERITQGVQAGARQALAIEVSERVLPELGSTLNPSTSRVLSEALALPVTNEAQQLSTTFSNSLLEDLH